MPILKQLVSNSAHSKRRSRADLTAEMISAPLGDFRHTIRRCPESPHRMGAAGSRPGAGSGAPGRARRRGRRGGCSDRRTALVQRVYRW
uniref:Uncharacterized protein n=1 Tax=Dromaius novaehollandiae TaxID=8790 RepID=A0A8C4P7Q3_DRONO